MDSTKLFHWKIKDLVGVSALGAAWIENFVCLRVFKFSEGKYESGIPFLLMYDLALKKNYVRKSFVSGVAFAFTFAQWEQT